MEKWKAKRKIKQAGITIKMMLRRWRRRIMGWMPINPGHGPIATSIYIIGDITWMYYNLQI